MSTFLNELSLSLVGLAAESAISPTRHERMCKQVGGVPFTREKVERTYGPQAALAWDDLQAANTSFHREANRHLGGLL